MGLFNWAWVNRFVAGKTIQRVKDASESGATLVFDTGEQLKIEHWPGEIVVTPLDKRGKVIQQGLERVSMAGQKET